MLLKYLYDEQLAQASYVIGCPETKQALVIDPGRDLEPYLQAVLAHNLTLMGVAETHIHADFVSGVRELASATGAKVYLSREGGAEWQYNYPSTDDVTLVREGDEISVGQVRLQILHTPGHTPEHIAFLITDTSVSDEPFALVSGDCLFVGDVGRPDLLEVVAGYQDTARRGAKQQFNSLQRLMMLPDYVLVLPGHGAGTICGKAVGAMPSTSIGYEKRVNPALQFDQEGPFSQWLLTDQPEAPRYFAHMKQVNRTGAPLLLDLPQAQHIAESPEGLVPPNALFIDTRPNADYARKHLAGTVNIPISSPQFCTYVGWFVDYSAHTFFIAYPNDVQSVLKALLKIGVDDVPGYFTPDVLDMGLPTTTVTSVTPQEAAKQGLTILDVRGAQEYREAHIPGAYHMMMGDIPSRLGDLPLDQPFVLQCGSGVRSQLVWSLLERAGFTNMVSLAGGLDAWRAAGLPVEEE
jgi:hydroxyacylglutathione hydrolase